MVNADPPTCLDDLLNGNYFSIDIAIGEEKKPLSEWMQHEAEVIKTMVGSALGLTELISRLHDFYEKGPEFDYKSGRVTYFEEKSQHDALLNMLADDLIGCMGCSSFQKELIKFAIDYAARMHKSHSRKSGEPYSLHAFESARIVAGAGADFTTIICTLLHDVVEEQLDEHVENLIRTGLKAKGSNNADVPLKNVPKEERDEMMSILGEEIDNVASGILYSLGMSFYEFSLHIKGSDARVNRTVNNVMVIVDRLSRPVYKSYMEYIQRFLYPGDPKRKIITFEGLYIHLGEEFRNLVDQLEIFRSVNHESGFMEDFEQDVNSYEYANPKSDIKALSVKNSFRTMQGKIADRAHNTRTCVPGDDKVLNRLYNAAYKNIYFLQEADRKIAYQKKEFSAKPILMALADELNIAALYQVDKDKGMLEQKLSPDKVAEIQEKFEEYIHTDDASRFTEANEDDPFGALHIYEAKALDDNGPMHDLSRNLEEQYRHVLASRYILIRLLLSRQGLDKYQVKWLAPHRGDFGGNARLEKDSDFASTTFRRRVI